MPRAYLDIFFGVVYKLTYGGPAGSHLGLYGAASKAVAPAINLRGKILQSFIGLHLGMALSRQMLMHQSKETLAQD